MKTRLGLVAATLTAGLLISAAPSAHAETWRHTDATGDVRVAELEEGTPDPLPSAVDRHERRGDITRVTATYTRDSLRVATSLRAFDNADNRIQVRIFTSHSSTFDLVHVRRGAQVTTAFTRSYRAQECEGLRVTPTASGVVATVPRSCLVGAYRVRVGVLTNTYDRSYERGTRDDALRTGVTSATPRLGSWIAAG
ncbi:hypothetical protein [Nocardioides plantarum]|uniref:DUF4124 domain-containing protein n=1 Tax=Nocardioides plantarum TaxID=29299 RepID=A0ABV5K9S9_9ACTN|nr:hypothetical protein [Nocardioides plantarum]